MEGNAVDPPPNVNLIPRNSFEGKQNFKVSEPSCLKLSMDDMNAPFKRLNITYKFRLLIAENDFSPFRSKGIHRYTQLYKRLKVINPRFYVSGISEINFYYFSRCKWFLPEIYFTLKLFGEKIESFWKS